MPCPICKTKFKRTSNSQKFCSTKCRESTYVDYRAQYQLTRKDTEASKPDPNKIKCLYCGRYYVQVGTHVFQRHGITARAYREMYDLEVKRGTVPEWYREKKAKQCIANGTVNNLKAGKKFRFVTGADVPKYKRSHVTLERLKTQFKKTWKK